MQHNGKQHRIDYAPRQQHTFAFRKDHGQRMVVVCTVFVFKIEASSSSIRLTGRDRKGTGRLGCCSYSPRGPANDTLSDQHRRRLHHYHQEQEQQQQQR